MNLKMFAQQPYLEKVRQCGIAKLTDYKCFLNDTVHPAEKPFEWQYSENYNLFEPSLKFIYQIYFRRTTALLVIKDDKLIFEKYFYGYTKDSLMNSFSMAKTITAILTGIALEKGYIKSLDDDITVYLPEYQQLKGVTIRNLLTMTSGISWSEAFADIFSDVVAAYYTEDLDSLLKKQKIVRQPGKKWKYQCGNTIFLGLIVQRASKMPLAKFAEEYLWKPLGAKHYALWNKDKNNITKAFCCFYARPRDYALIGLMLLHKGKLNGNGILSEDYVNQMITPYSNAKYSLGRNVDFYGLQTWIYPKNHVKAFYLAGMLGQYVVILPEENAVFVRMGEMINQLRIRRIPPDFKFYLKLAHDILEKYKN